jgi:hypothetical protein
MKKIKAILFGIPATGDNIINQQPNFRSYFPKDQIEFNSWTYYLKVGSRVKKNNQINPWYKDRNCFI